MVKPKGKYAWTVKVGEKGQIVIPKEAREIFSISPGDTLILLGIFNAHDKAYGPPPETPKTANLSIPICLDNAKMSAGQVSRVVIPST